MGALAGTLDDVRLLKRRFDAHRGQYGLIQSEFAGLLSFKQPPVDKVDDIFTTLDSDHNGRIDGLEFLAAMAICCDGNSDRDYADKMRCACASAGGRACRRSPRALCVLPQSVLSSATSI